METFKGNVQKLKSFVISNQRDVDFDKKTAKQKSLSMEPSTQWRRMQAYPLQKLNKALTEKQKQLEKPCNALHSNV